MDLGGINVPEELLDAQEAGRLVVFAGAGVSMPPPSSLPDFESLVAAIGEGTTVVRERDEAPDRFLGRLELQGVDVHELAVEKIESSASRPNPLHASILKLFPAPEDVRLVTTNFDDHFRTAAGTLFGRPPDVYFAPALPLGNAFLGIVHLHGVIGRDAKDLVLTDRDFGLAYLTRGWATRFLLEVFQHFSVLFVGYSHGETVMHYLSRAVPRFEDRARYALVPSEQDPKRWLALGISPIAYPDGGASHEALTVFLDKWSTRCTWTPIDHTGRVRAIVNAKPPEVGEDFDYLRDAFRYRDSIEQRVKLKAFVDHAEGMEWLDSAEAQGYLDPLFQPDTEVGESDTQLARWLARRYVVDESDRLLAVVARKGGLLHPVLWHNLALALHAAERPVDASIFGNWIGVLIAGAPPGQGELLAFLLEGCSYPEHRYVALALFNHLTTPVISRVPDYFSKDDKRASRSELSLPADSHWLERSWANFFGPNLGNLVLDLLPMLWLQLARAHELLAAAGQAKRGWDPLSFHRSAIEPHDQDEHDFSGFGVLISGFRDVTEWIVKEWPAVARQLAAVLVRSDAPLLRRLAVHAVGEMGDMSPDEKIQWVLDSKALFDVPLKHEVFRLLRTVFPAASEKAKLLLIDQVGPPTTPGGHPCTVSNNGAHE